jgi:hypothetical protein
MYLETGLGQPSRQRQQPKQPPKAPADRFLEVYAYWDLKVPFRKDFGAFRQKVEEGIGRHIAANERKRISGLLMGEAKRLKMTHDYYSDKSESDFVTVRVRLRYKTNYHTDFDWLQIEVPPLSG